MPDTKQTTKADWYKRDWKIMKAHFTNNPGFKYFYPEMQIYFCRLENLRKG
jgi:hypothetical protein